MTFQVGDRVVVICLDRDCNEDIVREVGVIVYISSGSYLVEFDTYCSDRLHDGGGHSPTERGWWILKEDPCLALEDPSPVDVQSKVLRKCKTLWNKSKWVQRNKTLAY